MLVGVPKEIKNHEYRVGATPDMVALLVELGHRVVVETMAGDKIGFPDEAYEKAGAKIVKGPEEVYKAEMVIKVKEPLKSEYPLLKEGQILFCFLHLAPNRELTKQLVEKKVIAIAFETVTDDFGRLPLLTPMSEVAGRVSIQVGATALQMSYGGKGLLLGGVPGVPPAKVVILGGGVVGTQAAKMALGVGADVTIMDRRLVRLRELDDLFGPRLKTVYSTPAAVEKEVCAADLVIGAVLIPGKLAPQLVTEEMVKKMSQGSVFVDVAIDQGGCSETSHVTSFSDPTYVKHGVVHYCVANMPGSCARTSTVALGNATLPFLLALANKGYKKALQEDRHLKEGLNVCLGQVTNRFVAEGTGFEFTPAVF